MEDGWLTVIRDWASNESRIAVVYLFGSRAKGTHRPNSDIDIAVVLTDGESDTATGFAICEGDSLAAALSNKLPVPIDLEFAFQDDAIVWPAVRDHGILLYQAIWARCSPLY